MIIGPSKGEGTLGNGQVSPFSASRTRSGSSQGSASGGVVSFWSGSEEQGQRSPGEDILAKCFEAFYRAPKSCWCESSHIKSCWLTLLFTVELRFLPGLQMTSVAPFPLKPLWPFLFHKVPLALSFIINTTTALKFCCLRDFGASKI